MAGSIKLSGKTPVNDLHITFGMIVLNGEPFIQHNLRALYPFAHQIIVVEGACSSARMIATPDGHSIDQTLATLRRFKNEEDPEKKLEIVTAEVDGYDDGFWPEKDEMSKAYARRATGNYLWQVDVDEFYLPKDMRAVIELLGNNPAISAVSFFSRTFWGSLSHVVEGFFISHSVFHRLFAWRPGYRYITHRPPTVVDENGINLRDHKAVSAADMAHQGIFLHHYELLFPKQVREKCAYYSSAHWTNDFRELDNWMKESYLRLEKPFRVHMVHKHLSWLERFAGTHNLQIFDMVNEVIEDRYPGIEMRSTDDIEALLSSPVYRFQRLLLKRIVPFNNLRIRILSRIVGVLKRNKQWAMLQKVSYHPWRIHNTMDKPRITFGMIVLNGEPFIQHNLRALYPFAHQIIVVEGACSSARMIATPDGHSIDQTLATLRRFKNEEDPEKKLEIVTAEVDGYDDGFWPEKDEMSKAYARRATGNYLWQVDVDEFYLPKDMRAVIKMLEEDSNISAIDFPMRTFWGGLSYVVDGFFVTPFTVHRLFAWRPGYRYITHRPPTVVDENGINLRDHKAVSTADMAHQGIFLHHYELLFPKQVREKCAYYSSAHWTNDFRELDNWMKESYLRLEKPFRVHMVHKHLSWLERFAGTHNLQIFDMVNEVIEDRYPGIEMRSTDDIEALLSSPVYRFQRLLLRALIPLVKLKNYILLSLFRH